VSSTAIGRSLIDVTVMRRVALAATWPSVTVTTIWSSPWKLVVGR